MSRQNTSVLFFAGLMTGSLVGASVALLLAPQSGAATRSQIRDKGLELKDGAVEGLAEAGHRTQEQIDAWQEKGQEVTDAIGRSKDSVIKAVSQSKDRIVEAAG